LFKGEQPNQHAMKPFNTYFGTILIVVIHLDSLVVAR